MRRPHYPAYASGGSLSFSSERKRGKNAAKTKVLESFRERNAVHNGTLYPANRHK